MEISAIIVARGGSQRVKNKALLELNGETLLGRKIRQLLHCASIARVIVGSESKDILKHAQACGAEVVRRPDYYCDESVCTANEMIANMCSLVKTDIVVWAHCTNPLLSTDTYDDAVNVFLRNQKNYDSLVSVVELKEHLWTQEKKPFNYDPYASVHTLAKDLPSLYMQDGGIFIQYHAAMVKNSYFFGQKPYLYIIPEKEFLDINTPRDVKIAQALID